MPVAEARPATPLRDSVKDHLDARGVPVLTPKALIAPENHVELHIEPNDAVSSLDILIDKTEPRFGAIEPEETADLLILHLASVEWYVVVIGDLPEESEPWDINEQQLADNEHLAEEIENFLRLFAQEIKPSEHPAKARLQKAFRDKVRSNSELSAKAKGEIEADIYQYFDRFESALKEAHERHFWENAQSYASEILRDDPQLAYMRAEPRRQAIRRYVKSVDNQCLLPFVAVDAIYDSLVHLVKTTDSRP